MVAARDANPELERRGWHGTPTPDRRGGGWGHGVIAAEDGHAMKPMPEGFFKTKILCFRGEVALAPTDGVPTSGNNFLN